MAVVISGEGEFENSIKPDVESVADEFENSIKLDVESVADEDEFENMEEQENLEQEQPDIPVPAKMLHNFIPIHPDDMEFILGRPLLMEEVKTLQADWERGFTLLSDSQKREFDLEEASTYSSRQAMAKLLRCSPPSITEYVGALHPLTPTGYLINEKGKYTAECAHELLVYARFAKRKLPSGEQNPLLFLKDSYLQSLKERAEIYKSWYLDRNASRETITSLAVIPSAPVAIAETIDAARQAEQVCAQAVLSLLPKLWEGLEATVIQQATEIRAKAYGIASDVIKNPKQNEIFEEHNDGDVPSG